MFYSTYNCYKIDITINMSSLDKILRFKIFSQLQAQACTVFKDRVPPRNNTIEICPQRIHFKLNSTKNLSVKD